MKIGNIPAAMRSLTQWVLWGDIERNGNTTKVPFRTSGLPASSTDKATWGTFADCLPHLENYSGLGFVFSPDDAFCGIDLDGCRDPKSGKVADWAREIIAKFDSYSEVSPSRTGIKIFCRGQSPLESGKKRGVEQSAICGKQPGIEIYDHARYFAVTGLRLAGVSPNPELRQEAIDWLAATYFAGEKKYPPLKFADADLRVIERARKYLAKCPPSISGQGGHNAAFYAACILVIGFGLAEDSAFSLLSEWNVNCQPLWSDKELRHKVKQAAKQTGERNYLRDAQPDQWDNISPPKYACQQQPPVARATTIITLEAATRELIGGKPRERLLETGLPGLDAALGGGFALGEMVIIAARPSHGKSMCGLQMIHCASANLLPCMVVSEEMANCILGKRTLQYASEVPEERWDLEQENIALDVDRHFENRAPTFLVTCGTIEKAFEEIEKGVEQRGVKLVVVDYATLLQSKGSSRYEQATNVSLKLRQAASQFNIAVVALCQLNRAIESRKQFLPMTADIRETGQFEQDADVILFVVWPHKIDSRSPAGEYLIFVSKNRNRGIRSSVVKCVFEPARQRLVKELPPPRTYHDDFKEW